MYLGSIETIILLHTSYQNPRLPKESCPKKKKIGENNLNVEKTEQCINYLEKRKKKRKVETSNMPQRRGD